ncbi:MAG: hypothetical protein IJB97_04940, partial [Clostridia bacterium]|nr:hypothetical protein [Clostridia bacterium]
TIEKAKLTISLWTPGTLTFTYNGEAQYLKVNDEVGVAGVVGDERVTFSYAVTDSVNVGEYTQTATLATDNDVNKNYEIVAGASKQYSIVKKTIGIVWKNDFTYNGGEQYAEVDSVVGAVNGENPTFTYAVKNTVDAGEYTQTATLAADNDVNKNYEIVSGSETCEYTIRKKQILLNWNSSFTYNGGIQFATVESVEGVIGNQEPTFAYTVTDSVNAGEYTQTVALEDGNDVNKNYEILSGFVSREFQIEKKKISLTWKDTLLTYNGAAQYATVENVEGLIGDDQVTFNYEVTNSVNAQAYSQKAILADGNDENKNYWIEWASETCGFTIKAKEITLTWKDTSLTYNGEAQYATVASVEGVIGSEQVTFSYGVTDSVEAGSYTQTATTSNGNYKIKNPTQTFTIAAAPDQDEQA